MNTQKNRLRRQESTASAPSLIVSSSTSLTGNESNLAKTSNENVKLNAQKLKVDNALITKSTSSLLSIQQDRISSALKLKRRNFFTKSASEDNNIQQQDIRSDTQNPAYNRFTGAATTSTGIQHQTTRWKRFLQMKRVKSVCSESVTDLSTSSLTSNSITNSSEIEPTLNETNLKVFPYKDTAKVKQLLFAKQSAQSLTNKPNKSTVTKLTYKSNDRSDNKSNNKLDTKFAAINLTKPNLNFTSPNRDLSSSSNISSNVTTTDLGSNLDKIASTSCSNTVSLSTTNLSTGFNKHKKRRSRRGSYRSNLRSNRNLTTQYFRTSFDSAVQNQHAKRNTNLLSQDTCRACSFDNSCLTTSSSLNYSNQTISSLGISYLIDDIHQLSLEDDR